SGNARGHFAQVRRRDSSRRTVVRAGRTLPAARRHDLRHHRLDDTPFFASCARARLTADGVWLLCLYAATGTDLRRPLRAGATRDELRQLIRAVWSLRADRGAEERLGLDRQTTLVPLHALKKNAHLEMHTRGG